MKARKFIAGVLGTTEANKLQWSRADEGAEIGAGNQGQRLHRRFNGAAPMKARKLFTASPSVTGPMLLQWSRADEGAEMRGIKAGDGADFLASMEPRR